LEIIWNCRAKIRSVSLEFGSDIQCESLSCVFRLTPAGLAAVAIEVRRFVRAKGDF
jgi:hypothetical protein